MCADDERYARRKLSTASQQIPFIITSIYIYFAESLYNGYGADSSTVQPVGGLECRNYL
jgi:hypothetical protein